MLEKASCCKVNLLLNILGKRPDGFHELETVMHPVALCDRLRFTRAGSDVQLTCSNSQLSVDAKNLVFRAASLFLESSEIREGVRIHLQKEVPIAAGLGGGSGNAATTLLALNDLFGNPLALEELTTLASRLGSDVPFFLQTRPALATGRGEVVRPLEFFPLLRATHIVLIRPGFGISTQWAYEALGRFPEALGKPGRAERLIALLNKNDRSEASKEFYNSLEAPALHKYPLLELYQQFLRENGAWAALMSGSGSTTFALVESKDAGETLLERFKGKFGSRLWSALAPLGEAVG